MRKDMYRRSKDVESNDAAEENGSADPLSGSADPFDALVSGKTDETSGRSNGKRQPSPIPGMKRIYERIFFSVERNWILW